MLAYKTGNGKNTNALRKTFDFMLSNKAQAQADDLGYVPLQGGILSKARAAVKKVGN